MIYARMPFLGEGERLARLPELDLDDARVGPAEAAAALGLDPAGVVVAMVGARPVYRFEQDGGAVTVGADDGLQLAPLDRDAALALVRRLYPEHAATVHDIDRVEEPDQWTLPSRSLLPAWRVTLGDDDDTWVYVAAASGEIAMDASRGERRSAYLSAVPHWLYFTPLRRHGALWSDLVIALSAAGSVLAASGLVSGLLQARRRGRGAEPAGARPLGVPSPYRGWMRWHHYAGLIFGLFTFTWVLSGCLSMDPFEWHGGSAPTRAQELAVAGGPARLGELTQDRLRQAQAALAASGTVKELATVAFAGELYLLARRGPLPPGAFGRHGVGERGAGASTPAGPSPHPVLETALYPVLRPERGVLPRLGDEPLLQAALAAMPGIPLRDARTLTAHDAYYYPREQELPLPVLRARFDDDEGTWLYLDPRLGRIVRRESRRGRVNRWLYHGLHSLDFPLLHNHRPLWDVVMVTLSLGGILVAATSIADGWRRLARHLRRLVGGGSS